MVRAYRNLRRGLVVAGVFVASVGMSTVPAQAQIAPLPTAAQLFQDLNNQLAPLGLEVPTDTPLGNQYDATVAGANAEIERINKVVADADAAVTAATTADLAAPFAVNDPQGPNYRWVNDPLSQILAATPGPVLHRVDGSWFNAPDVPEASKTAESQGKALFGPSTPVFIGQDNLCTITATGTDADGRKVAITAGHCGKVGDAVYSADAWKIGPAGTVVARGTNLDYAVIELGSNAEVTGTYNGVKATEVGNQTTGETLCKQGVATAYTCGVVWDATPKVATTQICAMQGDSGAPVLQGNKVVGLVNGGVINDYNLACKTPLQGGLFMPTVTTNMQSVVTDINSRDGVGKGFALAK